MAKQSIRDRLIQALAAKGWTHDSAHRTRKYHVMRPPADGDWPPGSRYFIGKSGALRYSSAGNVTAAVPHDMTKGRLLAQVPA